MDRAKRSCSLLVPRESRNQTYFVKFGPQVSYPLSCLTSPKYVGRYLGSCEIIYIFLVRCPILICSRSREDGRWMWNNQASAFKDPWKESRKWVECVVLQWIQTVWCLWLCRQKVMTGMGWWQRRRETYSGEKSDSSVKHSGGCWRWPKHMWTFIRSK